MAGGRYRRHGRPGRTAVALSGARLRARTLRGTVSSPSTALGAAGRTRAVRAGATRSEHRSARCSGRRRRCHRPGPTEGLDTFAFGLSLGGVATEAVQGIAIVGDLALSTRRLDYREFARHALAAHLGGATRHGEGGPDRGAFAGAGELAALLTAQDVKGLTVGRIHENLSEGGDAGRSHHRCRSGSLRLVSARPNWCARGRGRGSTGCQEQRTSRRPKRHSPRTTSRC